MIHIVTALHAEARPLIDRLGLRARHERLPFPVFDGDGATLVICGVGKVPAAFATGWLGGASGPGRVAAWLNLGVCGHASLEPGSCRIAHRVEDANTRRRWYPPQIVENPCPSASLITVDRPETAYPTECLYDMEASGFYPAALRFASAEVVQSLKIVSDNAGHSPDRVTPALARDLVSEALPVIETYMQNLRAVAAELDRLHAEPPEIEGFLSRWRFTVTQRHQLLGHLRRWRALNPDRALRAGTFPSQLSTKALLRKLEAEIASGLAGDGADP